MRLERLSSRGARAWLATALLFGCAQGQPARVDEPAAAQPSLFSVPEAQRARLEVVAVERKDLSRPLHVPAVIAFNDLKTTDVVPLVSGRVQKVLVREGDRVVEGAPLLLIASTDSADTEASLKRDQATLLNKKAVLARDEDLYAHKALSLEELQAAQLDVSSAEASLESDEAHVRITGAGQSHAELRSPITGLVVARHVAVGQALQAGGTPVFTITDPSRVWVIAHVYPEDVKRVALGDAAAIHSPALEGPVSGKVTYIGAVIDTDTLTVPIRIEAENRRGLLKQGLYADAEIYPAHTESLQVLPNAALLRDNDNLPFVYAEVEPGQFARRHVTLGDQAGEQTIIAAGLKVGDRVLASGALFAQFADSLGN